MSAQYKLQNATKHSNWLAEMMHYYYQDRKTTQKQRKEISTELRLLAVKISKINSLDALPVIYEASTLFADYLSAFRHKEHKYALESSVRHDILNLKWLDRY